MDFVHPQYVFFAFQGRRPKQIFQSSRGGEAAAGPRSRFGGVVPSVDFGVRGDAGRGALRAWPLRGGERAGAPGPERCERCERWDR